MWEIFNMFFMAAFIRAVYELGSPPSKSISNPISIKPISFSEISERVKENPGINAELLRMFPPERLERIKRKELRKYKASQDKKWRNWMESVSR